jgi:hypothetical protein
MARVVLHGRQIRTPRVSGRRRRVTRVSEIPNWMKGSSMSNCSSRRFKAKTLELRSQRSRSGPPRREARALVLWVHVHWFELWGNSQSRSAGSESDASRDRNLEERKRNGQRVHVESNHWQRFQEPYHPQQCGSGGGTEGRCCSSRSSTMIILARCSSSNRVG